MISYIEQLNDLGVSFDEPWDYVTAFEQAVADYCGAPFAIAVDSCTHGMEACLRALGTSQTAIPVNTYVSVPLMLHKAGVAFTWQDEPWQTLYMLDGTPIIDGAVAFDENCYLPGSLFCLSFQAKKRLNLGRGGMILTDDAEMVDTLRRMVCDGRILPSNWRESTDDIFYGFHYHMTPDQAALGLLKLLEGDIRPFEVIGSENYPDIRSCPFAGIIA